MDTHDLTIDLFLLLIGAVLRCMQSFHTSGSIDARQHSSATIVRGTYRSFEVRSCARRLSNMERSTHMKLMKINALPLLVWISLPNEMRFPEQAV